MNDIFAGWKDRKFVVSDDYYYNDFQYVVVLIDFMYWHSVSDDLLLWCNQNNCTMKGLTVNIPDEKSLTLFYLRWA